MGWDLDVGISTSRSMRYSDVRFMGQRIAYEISIQNAYAAYGGPEVMQVQGGQRYRQAGSKDMQAQDLALGWGLLLEAPSFRLAHRVFCW